MKNYYNILNISETATADEIKAAFRKKAKETHPDQHGGDAKYQALFNDVVEAYEVLSDPQKKAAYDDQLKYGSSNPYASYGYGGNFYGSSYSSYGSGSAYGNGYGNGYGSGGTYGSGSGYGSGSTYGSGGSYGSGSTYGSGAGFGSYGNGAGTNDTGYGYYGSYANDDYSSNSFDSFSFDASQSKEEIYRQVKEMIRQAKASARAMKGEAVKAIIKGVLSVIVGILVTRYSPIILVGAIIYGALGVIRGVSAYRRISKVINDYEDEAWRKVEEILKERK